MLACYPRPRSGSVPEWPKGAGCKPVGIAYGGSNPPRPTTQTLPLTIARTLPLTPEATVTTADPDRADPDRADPDRADPDRAAPAFSAQGFDPAAVKAFHYVGFALDLADGQLRCHYRLDGLEFVEHIRFAPLPDAPASVASAADRAARLVFLVAGVSYYKAAAPPLIDFGDHPLTPAEATMLRAFYLDGLGEFAYSNGLDLRDLMFHYTSTAPEPVATGVHLDRPLVPFGGGIDSIVTVDEVRQIHADTALFILSRMGDRFAAIEAAARETGLPVLRAERELDAKVLRSRELGFRNGHVPVTGILSAIATLIAVLHGRGAVVMSNEWSASSGNLEVDGRTINHQYSKSAEFETLLRAALADQFTDGPEYFSLLRPYSELAIARRFAKLTNYHRVFRSCNRAFQLDPAKRHATWCGVCDKCCFIDLILAPFVAAADLRAVFGGREPLENPDTIRSFRTLLDIGHEPKPFECVGEVSECRAALQRAAARPDRTGSPMLEALLRELDDRELDDEAINALLVPIGADHIPDSYAPRHLVG